MVIQLVWTELRGIGQELIHRQYIGYTYGGYIHYFNGTRGKIL